MNLTGAFDAVTKGVAAAGAGAAIYTFITKNAGDVVPVVLTVSGLSYEGLLGVSGLVVVALELCYWSGPVHRRSSHAYRLMLTRMRKPRYPTDWEIVGQARRGDQVGTLLVGVFAAAFLGAVVYLGISEDLSDAFPVDSSSVTWFSGCLALGASTVVGARVLKPCLTGERIPRRKSAARLVASCARSRLACVRTARNGSRLGSC
jgi:hypothetical protein